VVGSHPAGDVAEGIDGAMTGYGAATARNKALHDLVVVQCLAAFGLQALIGLINLFLYAVDLPGAFGVLFWLVSAAVSLAAVVGLVRRSSWIEQTLFVAEVMIASSAAYVIWADVTSSYGDWLLRLVAGAFLLSAIAIMVALTRHVGKLLSKAGVVSLALLSVLGLLQFSLENYVIPNRTPPSLEVSAGLEEVGRSGDIVHVRGTITWTNTGKARVWLPQALAFVEASDDGSGKPSPLDPDAAAASFNPQSPDRRSYARPLPADAGRGIVWLEDLAPYTAEMQPGEVWSREFLLDVQSPHVRGLELRVQMVGLTNTSFTTARTCDRQFDETSPDFLDAVEKPVENQGLVFSCIDVPVASRNLVRAMTDDGQAVVSGFTFQAPRADWMGPFLYVRSDDENPEDFAALAEAARRFSRQFPNSVVTSIAALPVPLALAGDGTSAGGDEAASVTGTGTGPAGIPCTDPTRQPGDC
jgi:hypothetical protein